MKSKGKILGLLLCCAMLFVIPQAALAANSEPEVYVNGQDIMQAENHTLQCGEGTAEYDAATNTLTLQNATLTNGNLSGRSIQAVGTDGLNIKLVGENVIDYENQCIFQFGDLKIFSEGEEKGSLTITNANFNGIACTNGSLTISNVNLSVNSDNDVAVFLDNADLSIVNSEVTAKGKDYAIADYSVQGMQISGSVVTASAVGEAPCCGIFCQGAITIDNESDVTAQGAEYGIHSSKTVTVDNSKLSAQSRGNLGLYSEENIEIKSGSEVNAEGYYNAVDGVAGVKIDGSKLTASSKASAGIASEGAVQIINGSEVVANADIADDSDTGSPAIIALGNAITISDSRVEATSAADRGIVAAAIDMQNSVVKAVGNVAKEGIFAGDDTTTQEVTVSGCWLDTSGENDSIAAANSVVIKGNAGTVIGNAVLPGNVTVPNGKTVTVPKGSGLTVPQEIALAVESGGKLVIEKDAAFDKQGNVTGTVVDNNGSSVGGGGSGGGGGGSGGGGGGGSAVQTCTLTFDTNGGNAIKAVSKTAGDVVKLGGYAPTREGWEFDGWYADKELKNKITEIKLDSNKTVYAAWRQEGATTGDNPFGDVSANQWFYDDVMFVYEKGLMNGAGQNTFEPDGLTTRGMLATILWRLEGSPAHAGGSSYNDVAAGRYYTDAIGWSTDKGIYTGFGEGVFRPDEAVTREQLAAVLCRYAEYKGLDVKAAAELDRFADADQVSDWSAAALKWAVGGGIVNGQGNNILNPQGAAQRADIAAMLHRFMVKTNMVG